MSFGVDRSMKLRHPDHQPRSVPVELLAMI